MSTRSPSKLAFLVPGMVCLGIAAALSIQMYDGLMLDLYWPSLGDALSLDAAGDDVEVYLDGELLQRRIEQGELRREDGSLLRIEELKVRVNQRARVQRAQLVVLAAAAGAGGAFLIGALLAPGRRPRQDR